MKSLASLRGAKTAGEAADWFFQNSLDIFLVSKDGLVQLISPSWTHLTGWSAAETLGRQTGEFVHADDLASRARATREVVDRGMVTFEHRVYRKSGDSLWVRTRVKRLADGTDLSVIQDISEERRRAQEAEEVTRAAALLRASAGVNLWRYHPDFDAFEIDPDFRDPSPMRRRDACRSGATMFAPVHQDDVAALESLFAHTVATGELGRMEFRRDWTGQAWRSMRVAWRGSRQLASGRWEVLVVAQDLTELMVERDLAKAAGPGTSRASWPTSATSCARR